MAQVVLPQVEQNWIRWLSVMLRLAGVGFLAFFSFLAFAVFVDTGPQVESLIRWGSQGEAYELMICSIYIVWGIFLWLAANNPMANKMFLDFSIVANFVHFSVMTVEGIVMPGEHAHLYGDIALGWLGFLPFAIVWSRVRKFAQ